MHSGYPLARRRRSYHLDPGDSPINQEVYAYGLGYDYERGGGHRHDDSIGSSYNYRQKMSPSEDDSIAESLSFEGGRGKGEYTDDEEDGGEEEEVGSIK